MKSRNLNLVLTTFIFIVFLSSCEDRAIKLTKRKIKGTWIETKPCSPECDTIVFGKEDEFNPSLRWNYYTTYSIPSEDTLRIKKPDNFSVEFFIEFSDKYNELKIFDYKANLTGSRQNVYFEKYE